MIYLNLKVGHPLLRRWNCVRLQWL